MNAKSLAQDLDVLRLLTERFNRNLPIKTAVWQRGSNLETSDFEHHMLVRKPEGLHGLPAPVAIDDLRQALRTGKPGEVTIDACKTHDLSVIGPSGSQIIKGAAAPVDIPPLPKGAPFTRRTEITIPADVLEYAARASSDESVRYALVSVMIDGQKRNVVASDGKRLHVRPFKCLKRFPKLLVPTNAVEALIAAQKRESYAALSKLGISDEPKDPVYASLLVGRFMLYARLIQGHFPDYAAVVPKSYQYQVRLDAPVFRSSLKDLVAFCRQTSEKSKERYCVRFEREDVAGMQYLKLISGTNEKGHKSLRVKILESKGHLDCLDQLTIDPRYVYDASWNNEETVIQGNNQTKAVWIDASCVLMPLTVPIENDEKEAFKRKTIELYNGDGNIPALKASETDRTSTWRRSAVARVEEEKEDEPMKPSKPAPKAPRQRPPEAAPRFKETVRAVDCEAGYCDPPKASPAPREEHPGEDAMRGPSAPVVYEKPKVAETVPTPAAAPAKAKKKLSEYKFTLFG